MFSIHLRFANKKIQQWALNQEKISNDQGLLKLYFRPFLRWFDRNLESVFIDGGKEVRTTKPFYVLLVKEFEVMYNASYLQSAWQVYFSRTESKKTALKSPWFLLFCQWNSCQGKVLDQMAMKWHWQRHCSKMYLKMQFSIFRCEIFLGLVKTTFDWQCG